MFRRLIVLLFCIFIICCQEDLPNLPYLEPIKESSNVISSSKYISSSSVFSSEIYSSSYYIRSSSSNFYYSSSNKSSSILSSSSFMGDSSLNIKFDIFKETYSKPSFIWKVDGDLGLYPSSNNNIVIKDDYTSFTEGNHSLKFIFNKSSNFAFFFYFFKPYDLSSFDSGYLHFDYKGKVNFFISVKDNSKSFTIPLNKLITLNDSWESVSIPLRSFKNVDYKNISSILTFNFPYTLSDSILIDNVYLIK